MQSSKLNLVVYNKNVESTSTFFILEKIWYNKIQGDKNDICIYSNNDNIYNFSNT